MEASIVILVSLIYLVLLFGIAIYANRRSKSGQSIVNNPYVYSLSLAVYCTVWTFYGSIGRAADSGLGYVAVYLGPTIISPVWYMLMRKIILISKQQRVTSIADFISSRYGKSTFLGAITTIILVFGIIPYISIQLKAIGHSFDIITDLGTDDVFWDSSSFYRDKVNYFTILLSVFTILFGTRSLDPNERHEGLIAAIAFESIVKLIAFLFGGIFVVYVLFNGLGDVFSKGMENEYTSHLMQLKTGAPATTNWFWVMILSAVSVVFLPRQFHVSVVENNNISFTRQASWFFPAYMLLISFFVLPIAIAGKLLLPTDAEPDMFLISLPLSQGYDWLALFVYLGGFSASASMVVLAVIALSIMVSNNILMPIILKTRTAAARGYAYLSVWLLYIRRVVIVIIMFLAYGFYKSVSNNFPLVSIGLISFTAILQLAPAIIGGLFWTGANKKGAASGLIGGFLIWLITLPIPTLAESGIIDGSLLTQGYFGVDWLKPYALFGLENTDHISNACIWSMIVNIGLFVVVSLLTSQDVDELAQGDLFINIEKYTNSPDVEVIPREASVQQLRQLLIRYLGSTKARKLLNDFDGKVSEKDDDNASNEFINYIEKNLTGAFGSASASLLLSTDIRRQNITLEQLNDLLKQTKEILEYSQALEEKTEELTQTTKELADVNTQLKQLDVLKAEFVSTVTHELRTPITTIRSFAQILDKKDDIDPKTKKEFLTIILNECDRIRRLINQVLEVEKLDVEKVNSGESSSINETLKIALKRLQPQLEERGIDLIWEEKKTDIFIRLNQDKVLQVLLNLLSNAIKFCDPLHGIIKIEVDENILSREVSLKFWNNGQHIPEAYHSKIFDKFTQVKDGNLAKPEGSGLGLYITRKFVEQAGGSVFLTSSEEEGTTFALLFPAD